MMENKNVENEYVNEIQEVLLKVADCKVNLQLQECFVRAGKPIFTKINDITTELPKAYLQFTPRWVYFNVEYQYEKDVELQGMINMWNQYLNKNTDAVEKGLKKVYVLSLQFFNLEDGMCCSVHASNPILAFKEGTVAKFIFDDSDVHVEKMNIAEDAIDEEIDHEMKIREEQMVKENDYLNSDSAID